MSISMETALSKPGEGGGVWLLEASWRRLLAEVDESRDEDASTSAWGRFVFLAAEAEV